MWLLDLHSFHDGVRYTALPKSLTYSSDPMTELTISRSCGTLTEAATVSSPGGWGQNSIFTYSCDKDRLFDTTNWCQTTPYKNVAGSAAGETIFVFTDCNGGAVMWEKMKNKPIYSYPGVSTAQKPTWDGRVVCLGTWASGRSTCCHLTFSFSAESFFMIARRGIFLYY